MAELGQITIGQVKHLKKGSYLLVDGIPCKVVEMEFSKTGKHGSEKARITAIDLFRGSKKVILKPGDAQCEIPIINKKMGQVIADMGEKLQIMDLESYETFEIVKDPEMAMEQGATVEYMEVMGQKAITKVKGE